MFTGYLYLLPGQNNQFQTTVLLHALREDVCISTSISICVISVCISELLKFLQIYIYIYISYTYIYRERERARMIRMLRFHQC